MAFPGIAALVLFSYVPMSYVLIAFLEYNPIRGLLNSSFVGVKNFIEALQDYYFRQAFINTVIIKLGQTLVTFPFSVLLALFLNEAIKPVRRVIQTASILPYFISWVAIATIFRNLLSPSGGLVNEILIIWLGKQHPIQFLSDPKIFRLLIIFQDAWKMGGFWALIYLSAITSIDPSLYESAMIDGANRWQCMWYITIPGISTTLSTMFIILIGYLVLGPFEQVFSQYSPTVYSTGDIIETFTFRLALSQQRYSYATAVGFMQGILALILVILTNKIIRSIEEGGGAF
jgi:ABC-type polysaccharide transport system permease subunit